MRKLEIIFIIYGIGLTVIPFVYAILSPPSIIGQYILEDPLGSIVQIPANLLLYVAIPYSILRFIRGRLDKKKLKKTKEITNENNR